MDGLVEVISKQEFWEFLGVSHSDFYSHVSVINNIANDDKLEILAEFDNSLSVEAHSSEIERFIGGKFGELITAYTEKKMTSLSRNMTKKHVTWTLTK